MKAYHLDLGFIKDGKPGDTVEISEMDSENPDEAWIFDDPDDVFYYEDDECQCHTIQEVVEHASFIYGKDVEINGSTITLT